MRLSRKVANEFILISVLFPFMTSELSAVFHDSIFCSDASDHRGAVCEAAIGEELSSVLWKACKSKGACTRLLSSTEALVRKLDVVPGMHEDCEWQPSDTPVPGKVQRPLAHRFQFVEIFAGSARVTACMDRRGYAVCPPIDLSYSEEYDLSTAEVMSWLSYLISHRLIMAFIVELPCTTFSIMRRPALRDRENPYGFDPSDPQTKVGNVLALRGLQSMKLGLVSQVAGVFECPLTSKVKNLPPYKELHEKAGVERCRTDSCCFGSPHLKSFAFSGVHVCLNPISRRCKCTGPHVQVQGKLTKLSATYTWELAEGLASCLADTIDRL